MPDLHQAHRVASTPFRYQGRSSDRREVVMTWTAPSTRTKARSPPWLFTVPSSLVNATSDILPAPNAAAACIAGLAGAGTGAPGG